MKRLGLRVWLDRWEIKAGDKLRDRVAAGIQDARYFLVVLSPNSINAPWVKYELDNAMIREIEMSRVVVLPILYGEIDPSALPTDILGKLYIDFRKRHLFDRGVQALYKRVEAAPYRYKILDGETIVDLVDEEGRLAKVTRRRHIRCLSTGLDQLWDEYYTDGSIENLTVAVGTIAYKKMTLGKLLLRVNLDRALCEGEELTQIVQCDMIESFKAEEEYWLGWVAELCEQHNYTIIFPVNRPPKTYSCRRRIGVSYIEPPELVTLLDVGGRPALKCSPRVQVLNEYHQLFWTW